MWFSDVLTVVLLSNPIGSTYAIYIYMVTWIPSIYPIYVSIFLSAPWIRHGNCHDFSRLPGVPWCFIPWFSAENHGIPTEAH